MKQQTILINIQELASLLDVKESWIRSRIFRNEIPYIKLGHLIRFDPIEIKKWIELKKFEDSSWS